MKLSFFFIYFIPTFAMAITYLQLRNEYGYGTLRDEYAAILKANDENLKSRIAKKAKLLELEKSSNVISCWSIAGRSHRELFDAGILTPFTDGRLNLMLSRDSKVYLPRLEMNGACYRDLDFDSSYFDDYKFDGEKLIWNSKMFQFDRVGRPPVNATFAFSKSEIKNNTIKLYLDVKDAKDQSFLMIFSCVASTRCRD